MGEERLGSTTDILSKGHSLQLACDIEFLGLINFNGNGEPGINYVHISAACTMFERHHYFRDACTKIEKVG